MSDNTSVEDLSDEDIQNMLNDIDYDSINQTISAVLDYLTVRAIADTGYYILTDDKTAIAIFAADKDVETMLEIMPKHFKSASDVEEDVDFIQHSDPGDEQDESE